MRIPGLGHLFVPCSPGMQGSGGCDSFLGDPLRALISTVASTDPAGQEYVRNSASLEVSAAVPWTDSLGHVMSMQEGLQLIYLGSFELTQC